MSNSDSPDTRPDEDVGLPHHEESDVNVKVTLWFAAALVAIIAVIQLSLWLLFHMYDEREAANNPPQPLSAEQPRVPPDPRLQVTPRLDLQELRAQEAETLNNYSWVDRQAGI